MNIWLTGCTAGMGRALLGEFAELGHVVVGCGRNQDALDELRELHPSHHFIRADVADEQSVKQFSIEAKAAGGVPDVVINNASIINRSAPLWEISADEFEQVLTINVAGVANVIRHSVPDMIAQGAGTIVNFSSGWGRTTSPDVAPYCASKWAIEGLTQAVAQELPAGLAAVAVNPGVIHTEMLQSCLGDAAESYQSPEQWAVTAAPFLTSLGPSDNGRSLNAP